MKMKNYNGDNTTVSFFEPLMFETWGTNQNTIHPGDIRKPWAFVYGFPMVAAQLAAAHKLVLHCRQDQVFEMVAGLNKLLKQKLILNRAYKILRQLEQELSQKLARLIQIEAELVAADEIPELLNAVEQFLTRPAAPETMISRVENMLSPEQPTAEIAGLGQMLGRLQAWLPALEMVKEQGFHVVVQDQRRQPARPALHARRNEILPGEAGHADFRAGFLFPPKYHLTVWAFLLCRGDQGQSALWN